jgi:hypothetical protein
MVHVEEKVRKCDGKDKYLHPTELRRRKYIYLIEQLAKHLILSQE